jgi:hypothetical protein
MPDSRVLKKAPPDFSLISKTLIDGNGLFVHL